MLRLGILGSKSPVIENKKLTVDEAKAKLSLVRVEIADAIFRVADSIAVKESIIKQISNDIADQRDEQAQLEALL